MPNVHLQNNASGLQKYSCSGPRHASDWTVRHQSNERVPKYGVSQRFSVFKAVSWFCRWNLSYFIISDLLLHLGSKMWGYPSFMWLAHSAMQQEGWPLACMLVIEILLRRSKLLQEQTMIGHLNGLKREIRFPVWSLRARLMQSSKSKTLF